MGVHLQKDCTEYLLNILTIVGRGTSVLLSKVGKNNNIPSEVVKGEHSFWQVARSTQHH